MSKKPEELNLVVAASLGPAANAIAAKLQSQGVQVNVHAGASSLIARQIVNGLACDVVIVADEEWMDYLAKQNAIEAPGRKAFLGNTLVWIVRKGSDTNNDKRIALADPEHVPAGKYAKAALQANGTWKEVAPKVVAAPDVRTALLWVEQGEVDSAVVYESDARSSSKVVIRARLENKTTPIVYPIARCKTHNPRAHELYNLLSQSFATDTFRNFGFHIL